MSNLLKKDKGFTLIEIVLVLAIAGLIMVIVFLAVSGAQKSRRDTQRKNDIGRIEAAMENYASNTNGAYPATPAAFTAAMTGTYALSNTVDPLSGTAYIYGASVSAPSSSAGAGVSYALTGARVITVCIGLEQGGSSCRTNN